MKLTILGSGGAMPTPRPFCQCVTCKKARKKGEPYMRNSSSLYVNDAFTLIDCPENIGESLNRRDIKRVDNLFITHWHPDHTFGLRVVLEANYNFRAHRADKTINVYIPKKVYKTLKEKYPIIEYLLNSQKTGKLILIEDGDRITIGKVTITAIGYRGKMSDTYSYLLEEKNKRALYAPCDTISFERKIYNLDLLINECGLFSDMKTEIHFPDLIKRVREFNPRKTIFTHIEEVEINIWGWNYLEKMKKQYLDIDFEFAYDGMKLNI